MTYGLDAHEEAYQKTGIKPGYGKNIIVIEVDFRFGKAQKRVQKIQARDI